MFKKSLLTLSFISSTIFLNGCGASGGFELNYNKEDVKYEFNDGIIIESKRVIISSTKLAVIQGLAIGSATGGVIGAVSGGQVVQGVIIGGTAGAVAGGVRGYINDGNEVEAFQIKIRKTNDLKDYYAYIPQEVPLETPLQFVIREDSFITNMRLVSSLNQL